MMSIFVATFVGVLLGAIDINTSLWTIDVVVIIIITIPTKFLSYIRGMQMARSAFGVKRD